MREIGHQAQVLAAGEREEHVVEVGRLDRQVDDAGVADLTVESAGLDDVFLALTHRTTEAPESEEIPA